MVSKENGKNSAIVSRRGVAVKKGALTPGAFLDILSQFTLPEVGSASGRVT